MLEDKHMFIKAEPPKLSFIKHYDKVKLYLINNSFSMEPITRTCQHPLKQSLINQMVRQTNINNYRVTTKLIIMDF